MIVKVYIKNVTSLVSVLYRTQNLDCRSNRKHTQMLWNLHRTLANMHDCHSC